MGLVAYQGPEHIAVIVLIVCKLRILCALRLDSGGQSAVIQAVTEPQPTSHF